MSNFLYEASSEKMVRRTVALACDLYVFNSYSNRVDFSIVYDSFVSSVEDRIPMNEKFYD